MENVLSCALCGHVQGHRTRSPQGEELDYRSRMAYSLLDRLLVQDRSRSDSDG